MNVNFVPEILIKDLLDVRIRSTETGGLRSSLRAKKASEFAGSKLGTRRISTASSRTIPKTSSSLPLSYKPQEEVIPISFGAA
jgi:hypothetical protein